MEVDLTFCEKLAQTVRDVGQELIDNASDIAGENPMLSSMTITIHFEPEFNMLAPTIDVNKVYLCKRAYERLKGESHDD